MLFYSPRFVGSFSWLRPHLFLSRNCVCIIIFSVSTFTMDGKNEESKEEKTAEEPTTNLFQVFRWIVALFLCVCMCLISLHPLFYVLFFFFSTKATKICFDNFWQVEQTKSSSSRCVRCTFTKYLLSSEVIEKWTNYFPNKDVAMFECEKIRWKEQIFFLLNFKLKKIFGLLWWLTYRFYAGWPFSNCSVFIRSQLRSAKYADDDDDDPENSFVSVTIDLKSTS